MITKNVLLIDDNQVDDIESKVSRILKQRGISINFDYYKVEKSTVDAERKSIKSIKKSIYERYFNNKYDVVACDYNFEFKELNGFEIVRWIKSKSNDENKKIKYSSFILYSTEEDLFQEKINGHLELLKTLVKTRLNDFVKRGVISETIVKNLMSNEIDFNLRMELVKSIRDLEDLPFKGIFPKFDNRSIVNVTDEIERNTPNGVKLQRSMIDQLLSLMYERDA